MDPNTIRAQLATLGTELDGLRKLDTLSDDQDRRVDAIVNEINDLGTRLARAVSAEAASQRGSEAAQFVASNAQSRGRVSGVQAQGEQGSPATHQADTRSLGKIIYESEEFAEYRKTGSGPLPKFGFDSFFASEQRAIANTVMLPGSYLQPQRIPGIQRGADLYGSLRDVLLVGTATSDSLIFFQEASFTNAAAEVGEATATTGATGLKPESGMTFAQQTAVVATIAHWIPITKQLVWNAAELQSYIEGRLIDGLKLREDAELLNGNGTAPNLRGLNATSGVQVLDGTYFTATPVADTGTPNEKFNRIARARTLVQTVGRAQANFVVLNPTDLEKYQTSTDAQKQYFGGGPMAAGVPGTIFGLRIVVNENQAAGTALVGDGRQAQIWDRMDASVQVGYINDQFTRNMSTLLAEERVGLTVYRPSAFAKVTLP